MKSGHNKNGVKADGNKFIAFCERLSVLFSRIFVILFFAAIAVVPVFSAVMLIKYGNLLVNTVAIALLAIVLLFVYTKALRKRMVFYVRLKRLCKERCYKIIKKSGFWISLFTRNKSAKNSDIILKTPTHTYYVRFLTLKKYNATLYFEPNGVLKYTKHSNLKDSLRTSLSVSSRTKIYSVDFCDAAESSSSKVVRALVVNPVCKEFFARRSNGALESVGSGEMICGFTVFTGSGFIEAVRRNDDQEQYIR